MEVEDIIKLAKKINKEIENKIDDNKNKLKKKRKNKRNKNKNKNENEQIENERNKKRFKLTLEEEEKEEENEIPSIPNNNNLNNTISTTNTNLNEEQSNIIEYPYIVNSDDHCETKVEAYELIADILDKIAQSLQKTRQNLSIYDPYFCEGSMIAALNSLGFENVYNRKEDFYEVQRLQKVPVYDVLITNPPYSDDHINRLFEFVLQSNKPYFLLMPNYVYAKDYYYQIPFSKQPFYVVPVKRLQYTTPKGRRQSKSAKYTSPFPSFWYCHLGTFQSIYNKIQKTDKRIVVNRINLLPVEVLADGDPRKKKERNALKRKKNKEKKKNSNSNNNNN